MSFPPNKTPGLSVADGKMVHLRRGNMSKHHAIDRRKRSQKTYYHFSDGEFRAWLAAWRATRSALEDAKLIMEEELQAMDIDGQQRLQDALTDIQHKIAQHNDLKLSFYTNGIALAVPAPDHQTILEQLSDNVDRLVGSADGVEHVHHLAMDIFERFKSSTVG